MCHLSLPRYFSFRPDPQARIPHAPRGIREHISGGLERLLADELADEARLLHSRAAGTAREQPLLFLGQPNSQDSHGDRNLRCMSFVCRLAQGRKPVRAPELAALGEGDEIRLRTTAPSS